MATYEQFKNLLGDQATATNEEQVQDLYKFIVSQPNGPATLQHLASTVGNGGDILKSPQLLATTQSAIADDGYTLSDSTNGSILNLIVYQKIQIKDAAAHRMIDINLGGFVAGLPGGALFGTIYYNTPNDLTGDVSVVLGSVGTYLGLWFYKNGTEVATFQSGNVGFTNGGAYGSGTWESM